MTRILYAADPKSEAHLAALAEVKAIRSELSRLRRRLREVGKLEAVFPFDSLAEDAASTMSVALVALYTLEWGDRSFQRRAELSDELWADVEARPEMYRIEPGMSPERAKRGLPAFDDKHELTASDEEGQA